MKLPLNFFLQGIDEKKVYYFSSTKLNTAIPHYFICILKGEKDTLLLVFAALPTETINEKEELKC